MVSDTQVQVHIVEVGTLQWVHWVEDSPSMLSLEEDNTVNLVVPVRGRRAENSIKSAVLMANSYRTLRFTVSDSQGQLSATNRRGGHHVEVCHRRMSKHENDHQLKTTAMPRVEEKNSEEGRFPSEVNDVAENGSRRQEVLW